MTDKEHHRRLLDQQVSDIEQILTSLFNHFCTFDKVIDTIIDDKASRNFIIEELKRFRAAADELIESLRRFRLAISPQKDQWN